ncbi:stimulated by retinoic acid gene 6 protein-like, partial [Saccoglossus kowalevskii]
PIILVGLLVTLGQYLMARFVFLQDHGKVFALDNRRLFHNFTYFMFFYNVFLGIVSCLIRLFKSIIISAFVMSRIDQSTLPRKYERFDPGYRAYVGFLQLENAHTHPILVTFCNLLMSAVNENSAKSPTKHSQMQLVVNMENGIEEAVDTGSNRIVSVSRRRQVIRNRWFVALTLARNPGLQLKRYKCDPQVEMEGIPAVIDDVILAGLGPVITESFT